jgi:hypothetical protein
MRKERDISGWHIVWSQKFREELKQLEIQNKLLENLKIHTDYVWEGLFDSDGYYRIRPVQPVQKHEETNTDIT